MKVYSDQSKACLVHMSDGMGWMRLGIIGYRSSRSIFGTNKCVCYISSLDHMSYFSIIMARLILALLDSLGLCLTVISMLLAYDEG